MKFPKGKSGNPGGRPKVLGELQELARHHAPEVINELVRLALKAKSETARIAAGRELLDRGFGRPRQSVEVSHPEKNIVRMLLDDIDARNRENDRLNAVKWKLSGSGAPNGS
jgi:hypothetical protein